MFIKKAFSFFTAAIASFLSVSGLAGAEENQTKLQVAAYDATVGVQFRSALFSLDHGFEKTENKTPVRTHRNELQLLRVTMDFTGVKTDGKFELDLTRAGSQSLVRKAYLEYHINPIISVRAGRDELLLGGWEQKEPASENVVPSNYLARRGQYGGAPFSDSAPAIMAVFNLSDSGTLLFQAIDDVSSEEKRDAGRFNNNADQPAFLMQYTPSGGPVIPIVQAGTYDINHSKYAQAGLRADLGPCHSTFDYVLDMREIKGADDDSNFIQRINSAVFYLSYDFRNAMRPFVKASFFEARPEGEVLPANPVVTSCSGDQCLTNNAREYTAGAWFATPVSQITPFFAYTLRTGVFSRSLVEGALPDNLKRESVAQLGLSGRL